MGEMLDAMSPALAPTRPVAVVRRLARRFWLLIGIAGVLEVSGRRTGAAYRTWVIPVNLDGNRYVLAFGGLTDWARNLRAAGHGTLRQRGRRLDFNSIEVGGEERDRVIAKYLAGSGPVRKDFNRRPRASDHPTFRLEPIADPAA